MEDQQTLMLDEPKAKENNDALTHIEGSSPDCALKRPTDYEDYVVRDAAEKLAQQCQQWDMQTSAEEWIEDLVKARYEWTDGYALAKELDDRCHVSPDSELVDILDRAPSYLSDAHRKAVKRWVRIVGFTPGYAIGETVGTRHGNGKITKIYVETAQYVVDTKGVGNGGYIINAEDIKPAS